MTKADWFASTQPQAMLTFLRDTGRATDRKLRLFAAACCRRVWHLVKHEGLLRSLEVAERFADGQASREELAAAREAAGRLPWNAVVFAADESPAVAADLAVYAVSCLTADYGGPHATADDARRAVRGDLFPPLRDIIGNPFRPLPPLRDYKCGLVPRLAQAAYDDRLMPCGHLDPTRLAVMCDALLDAGLPADDQILLHLRGEGSHWRGCHVLDAILGRG
jgi:hypothetical protein